MPFHWRHDKRDGVSNQRRVNGLLNRVFRRRSKKTSKLHFIGLCEGNSPVTDEFPSQRACIAEIVSIWWRHYGAIKPIREIHLIVSTFRSIDDRDGETIIFIATL